jgi:hypothetical protein
MSESLEALRRANPRASTRFRENVAATVDAVRARVDTVATEPTVASHVPRRWLVRTAAAGSAVAVAAAVALFVTVGSPGSGRGVENAAAAIRNAATLTAASAERSGTTSVRMTHNGELWAHKVVRWNGGDVEITDDSPGRPSSGLPLLVVNGMLYGHDPCCEGWVELGPVGSIDPGTGTTPLEILAAVREDVGGTTLRRIVGAMRASGLTTAKQDDGSTVYRGTTPAGRIARETGFKEGQAIRVLPFGYVAHDEAANPSARLRTAVTVGADGIVRELAVTWGTWSYTVTYSNLGATPAITVPAHAKSLLQERLRAARASG